MDPQRENELTALTVGYVVGFAAGLIAAWWTRRPSARARGV
jgi:hypothetical protein